MPRLADQMPLAVVGERLCTDLVDCTDDPACLDGGGFWAVVVPYDGAPTFARFASVRPARPWRGRPWRGPAVPAWTSSLDQVGFEAGVRSIRDAIAAGDVYQVNLTRVLSAPVDDDADVAALGAALAIGNPAPYSAVVRVPDAGVFVASASPERFLRREGRLVWSSPIKGTAAHAEEFLAKDRAENVMIVDLLRNDVGRVAKPGTVHVPKLFDIESFPAVHHLVSTIRADLDSKYSATDLLRACFPGGSITGAPKVRAMQIIEELEPHRRSAYCGSIGYISRNGRMDTSITIRTLVAENNSLYAWAGGGVVFDSDCASEYQETLDKRGDQHGNNNHRQGGQDLPNNITHQQDRAEGRHGG